jgi:SAM-dependent methyltransferase
MKLPKSEAVAKNKGPILEVLKKYFAAKTRVLEIGSGTAEHAVYFAENIPHIDWITSDVKENLPLISKRLKMEGVPNVHGPELLEIGVDDFPKGKFDYVFNANSLHIMSWKEDKSLFKLLGKRLQEQSLVLFYGPFNFDGQYTSESNRSFDLHLKSLDPNYGIRNFEDILKSMNKYGFKLIAKHEMPANNYLIIFERLPFEKKATNK